MYVWDCVCVCVGLRVYVCDCVCVLVYSDSARSFQLLGAKWDECLVGGFACLEPFDLC